MSKAEIRAAEPAATEAETLAALSRLARKGAYAEPVDAGGAAYAVFSPRNSFVRAIAVLPGDMVRRALGTGWLEPEHQAGRYRLAAGGAKALRRARSAAPAATGAATPAPKPRMDPPVAARTPHEAPIVWLSRRKDAGGQPMISARQLAAGERLSADYWHAQLSPHVTANWSGVAASRRERRAAPDAGADMSDRVVAARTRVNRAIAAVGPELADILIDVCCHEVGLEAAGQAHGWPQRSAKIVLQLALTRLARHYGLVAPAPATGRLRHWGDDGYKPTLDAWQSREPPT